MIFNSSVFRCVKGANFILFVILFCQACNTSNTISLGSEVPSWCFYNFEGPFEFNQYLSVQEDYATSSGNVQSMQLLGCAYYQKGDILTSQEWLTKAYESGNLDSATALSAIYLKENNLNLFDHWEKLIINETEQVRWLRIIGQIKHYENSQNVSMLRKARKSLQYKISYEGETEMTNQLLQIVDNLLEKEMVCSPGVNPEVCSLVDFTEQKNYLFILTGGALSYLVPSIPVSWNHPDLQVVEVPSKEEDQG